MVEARPPLVQGLRSAEELRSFGAAIEEAAAARARGQARELWETVEQLLEELGGLGPQPCPALPGA